MAAFIYKIRVFGAVLRQYWAPKKYNGQPGRPYYVRVEVKRQCDFWPVKVEVGKEEEGKVQARKYRLF